MDTTRPAFCTNTVVFNFGKSNMINVGNAQTKFSELVLQYLGSTNAVISVNCIPKPKILNVTFRDDSTAGTVLKMFQDRKIRDELSPGLKHCRISWNLPKHLQEERNNLFRKVEERKAYGVNNLYVDEYDLTIRTQPSGTSPSIGSKVYNAVDHKQNYTIKDIPARTSSTPLKYSSEQTRASSEPFRIWYSVGYEFRYKHMTFHQFVKEVLGEYAKDVQMESETPNGFIVSLKPSSKTSIQTLLKRLPHGVYLN